MKNTLTFSAGSASFAGCSYAAGFHASTLCFAFGIVTAAAVLIAALSSKARLRAAAHFLNRLAGVEAPTPRKMSSAIRRRAVRRPSSNLEGVAADVYSALRNFGATRATAFMAAQAAAAELPAGSFEELFRVALPLSKAPKTA